MTIKKVYVDLLTEYITDVEKYGHRYYFKQHFKSIKKMGFENFKKEMISALEDIKAYDYVDIVDFHFESLFNSMCIYEDTLKTDKRYEEKNTQCDILFKEVDCLYNTEKESLKEKLENIKK